jgi:hypothetical protein
MDIEFARWGNAADHTNAQYVVQPCSQCPGCDDRCTRFRVNLTDEESDLTHYLVWSPGTVEFRTYYGRHVGGVPQASAMVHRWTHASEYVPEPGNENIRFNFWLHEGNAPASSQGDEVVITNFTWQEEAPMPPGQIVTNLINYPVTGCFEGADEVRNSGINAFEIDVIRDGEISESVSMEINYDPELSTENHTLLYSCDNPKDPATIVLDLDGGYILGVLSGANIVAATHNGRYVVDTAGNVYQTSNHTVVGERLPFSQTTVYPVFSNDDSMCYAGNEKIRFADRTLVSDQIPAKVDCRFARLLTDKLLIQGSRNCFWKINLTNDEVVNTIRFNMKRAYWGTSAVAPNGNFGFVTSYSWASGTLNIIDLKTGNATSEFDHLSDYMGEISFSNDRSKAFVGSYGNSFLGRGGIYVIDVNTQTKLSYYTQFGASSVKIGPDGLIYTSSKFGDHFGDGTVTQGSKDRRGIDVLLLNEDNELQFIKTYYLNYEDRYSTKPAFFIKTGPVLPDLWITDVWSRDSTIYYKIKNVGGEKAGASSTSLIVDGVPATLDSVASLDLGVERTESFNYTWNCTNPSDTIRICADHTNDVAEYNEENNCRTEILICQPNIWIGPVSFDVTLPPDVVSNYSLTLGNNGRGVLEFDLRGSVASQSGWPVTTGDDVASSPALGDIDGDGDIEVVVGSMDEKVYAWHHDGSTVSGWPKKTPTSWVCSSPALGDIDGDRDIEVVVGSYDRKVYAWHHDGSTVNGWPKMTGDHVYSSPALGDIDGDGDIEIVVGSNKVYAWHHDGSTVSGWPKITGHHVYSSPALGDIDGDGDLEVVVGSRDKNVYAWHHDGSTVSGWPKMTGNHVYSSPALGDIDGDGDIEIIIGSLDGKVYAWHHDASYVSGWPKTTGYGIHSSPALGDIDGDGDIEIVVGSDNGNVYAWHHDGSTVSGWPKKTSDSVTSSPALGDIDGDGDIEIVVGSTDAKVYAWHHDGSNVTEWPITTGYYVKSSPALGDIDGDGDIEVVVGSRDKNVYVWDCSGTYNLNNIEWGTFHHDVRHTGLYEKKPPKKEGWLYESPTNGTVHPGNQTNITVTFNTTGLPFGKYSANITIISNDPDENWVIIPVQLTVTPSQKGDLNGDGEITPADAAIALQLVVSGEYHHAADVSGDGQVTSLDALMILQAAAGAINL